MGIRELLAEQDAEFVSLRALLEQMSTTEGVTLQDAATALARWLNTCGDAPEFHSWTRIGGICSASRAEQAKACGALSRVANGGDFRPSFEDMDDDIPF